MTDLLRTVVTANRQPAAREATAQALNTYLSFMGVNGRSRFDEADVQRLGTILSLCHAAAGDRVVNAIEEAARDAGRSAAA